MCDCWVCVGMIGRLVCHQESFHTGHVKASPWSAAAAAICSAGASEIGFWAQIYFLPCAFVEKTGAAQLP